MIVNESVLRVRYSETDKMGYCYYGVYAQYLEVGRTELIRKFGLSYKELEENGAMLPVSTLNIKYLKPAFYDDELTIRTYVNKMPSIRIEFKYEIFNQHKELLIVADTILVFIDAISRKPIKPPLFFLEKVAPYFTTA
jgi:acyl-CoA thioester hydrolase